MTAAAGAPRKKPGSTQTRSARSKNTVKDEPDQYEPIMAYLRIRPTASSPSTIPYIQIVSSSSVRMTDPTVSHDFHGYRPSTLPSSSIYTFSRVFAPSTTQSDFFSKTTLPLVKDLLNGQNGLLFAYGVTNSGKTYTIQGGSTGGKKEGNAGILPRSLDVIFNSIEGLQGDGRFRPVRLHGIERSPPSASLPPPTPTLPLPQDEPALAQVIADHLSSTSTSLDTDPTVIKLDRNYEYSIWLTYAEVYNEKVYDLLATVKEDAKRPATPAANTSNVNNIQIPRSVNASFFLTRKALAIRPSPPHDNPDPDSQATGRYISGLRQFRVTSAEQAKALIKLGQLNRRVFGTLLNSQSSRSHGLVTIKVVRGHRGERDDPTTLQISRLTLVDLAGSERTKHTNTTGDRLREAGSINKSLMVLGQCMEVMRANQSKVAASLGGVGRTDTRDVRKALAVVPFRHSKLTEALGDYFIGDGRVVMIVNVNPYDTGYDENSHVMKFAALAREVYTTPAAAPMQRVPSSPTRSTATTNPAWKNRGPLKDPEIVPLPYVKRTVTIEVRGKGGRKESEACLEVVEEDEDVAMGAPEDDVTGTGGETGDSDGDGINPLVDALFDEVEELRMKLFESEMRCAIIEAETREEVMREMEERMRSVEKLYERRLTNEAEQNELKTDAKIDLLHRSGLTFASSSPAKKTQAATPARTKKMHEDMKEEQDVELDLMDCEDEGTDGTSGEEDGGAGDVVSGEEIVLDDSGQSGMEEGDESLYYEESFSQAETSRRVEIREPVPAGPPVPPLPAGFDGDEERDAEEDLTGSDEEDNDNDESDDDGDDDEDEGEEYGAGDESENSDDEEWVPPPAASGPATTRRSGRVAKQSTVSAAPVASAKGEASKKGETKASTSRLSKLAQTMGDLSISSTATDDSLILSPVKHESRPVKTKSQTAKANASKLPKAVVKDESASGKNLRRSARGRQ